MKGTKMLAIMVLALGLMVCLPRIIEAEPMGSAITYQGRLIDANLPADDYYEFQFRLYNSPEDGKQLGPMISLRGVDVIDGYFTVLLDFGALVYNGDARWLEIDTKPPGTPDPFITLSPRQELTPTPYARYAPVAGMAIDSIRGGGTSDHISKFASASTIEDSIIYQSANRIGIGTQGPQARLSIQMQSSSSPIDVDGLVIRNGLWNGGDYLEVQDFLGNPELVIRGGRIGIGTTSPEVGLHLKGDGWPASFVHLEGNPGYDAGIRLYEGVTAKWHIFNSTADSGLRIYNSDGSHTVFFADQGSGEVGIGTLHPRGTFEVSHDGVSHDFVVDETTGYVGIGGYNPDTRLHIENSGDEHLLYCFTNGQGRAGMFSVVNGTTTQPALEVRTTSDNAPALFVRGTAAVDVLEIMGADVAEKFPVTEDVKPGMVLAIDPEHPGKLCLSRGAYNRCVAGVVSGANGLPTGAILGNLPSQEESLPVALSGRVWVYCDATEHPVEPGDLLTTAERSGYAMAVTDYQRAQGAVIGKSMTRLQNGTTGLVLVLVNLQ